MNRRAVVNVMALAAGWIAVLYFFTAWRILPPAGPGVVPFFILGGMIGISLMAVRIPDRRPREG